MKLLWPKRDSCSQQLLREWWWSQKIPFVSGWKWGYCGLTSSCCALLTNREQGVRKPLIFVRHLSSFIPFTPIFHNFWRAGCLTLQSVVSTVVSLFWFTAGFYICFMPFKATWVTHMGSSPVLSMRLPWLRCFVKGADFSIVSHYLYCSCTAGLAAHQRPKEMISRVFFRDK